MKIRKTIYQGSDQKAEQYFLNRLRIDLWSGWINFTFKTIKEDAVDEAYGKRLILAGGRRTGQAKKILISLGASYGRIALDIGPKYLRL